VRPFIKGASIEIIREDGSLVFEKQAKRMAVARSTAEREQIMNPTQPDVLEQIANLLGVDATDQDAMTQALAALYVTPDAHQSAPLAPVTASAVARGRAIFGALVKR
jgi:hypothetical protein